MTRIVLPVMQPPRTSPSTYMSAIPGGMGFGSPTPGTLSVSDLRGKAVSAVLHH
jgi:hypothetical protein